MVNVSMRKVVISQSTWAAIPKISVGLQKVALAGHVQLGVPARLGSKVCAQGTRVQEPSQHDVVVDRLEHVKVELQSATASLKLPS
jgi:hypothetical protein